MRARFPVSIAMALAVTTAAVPAVVRARTETTPEPTFTSGPRAWALAATAILSYRNRDRLDILPPDVPSDSMVADTRDLLHNWWGIDRRSDLMRELAWLDREGHRVEFQKRGQFLSEMSDPAYKSWLRETKQSPEDVRRMNLLRDYYRKHGSSSFVAWDYARYISLCRWGYAVGFLSRSAAWERMLPAARKIQAHYHSWAEVGDDYLLARELWSPDETAKSGQYYRDIVAWLNREPKSVWNHLPWATDLGASAAR